ncbi:MAG: hypothetical protein KDA60_19365, partial [Planctomycetales bacterium]|nr:hypothetical protein [Planctomycetales bacterium]
MVKKILPIVFGLIVFGLGLGASVAWQQMQQAKLDEEEQQTDELVERVPSQPGDVVESVASNPQQTLPIVVRSESLSPEELFRLGEKFKR